MFYRLEHNLEQIDILVDTNTRDNHYRNPYLKVDYFKSFLELVETISLCEDSRILDAFEQANKLYIEETGTCKVDIYNPKHVNCIWEAIYENQKPKHITITRMDCSYFFNSVDSCNYYKQLLKSENGFICRVDIIEEYKSFIGDMKWLDNLNIETVKAKEIMDAASRFWHGEFTDSPIEEVLFQGQYILSRI